MTTKRNRDGIGSTDLTSLPCNHPHNITNKPTTSAATTINITSKPQYEHDDDNHSAYNVVLSNDPFQDFETITIPVRGKHPTQGIMLIPCTIHKDRFIINNTKPGMSSRNIKGWIRGMKNFHLLKINNQIPATIGHTNNSYIMQLLARKLSLSQDQKYSM